MPEEKKKKPEDEKEKKPDTFEQERSEEKKEEKTETSEDKKSEEEATDESQADENGEGATKDEEKSEDDTKEKSDNKSEEESKVPETPELSEADQLKAENLTLKTQLEAMKIGFTPDCMEDAVTLAEAIVKQDGVEIQEALQSVAKKYPDWKSDGKEKDSKSKGGFKIGADSQDNKNASDDRLNQAFGIKKKKGDK